MTLIYLSLSIVGIIAAVAVAVGALIVFRPLYERPYEPGDWISIVFAGLAAVLAGSAGIAVGLGADEYSVASWTQVSLGAAVAVVGIVLTVIGVFIYEPTPEPGEEPGRR